MPTEESLPAPPIDVRRTALVFASVALAGLLAHVFRLEGKSIRNLLAFTGGVYLIHTVLAPRWKEPFFALASVAAVFLFVGQVGGSYVSAAWVVGLGLGLLALCHLPVPFVLRVLLVLAAGVVLAWMRGSGSLPLLDSVADSMRNRRWLPIPTGVWVMLGAMFMFRLIIYLYDLRNVRPTLASSLAYFFLFPNVVVFPLFPVVDYRQFRTKRKPSADPGVHAKGAQWVMRGVLHLLCYRFVYLFLTVPELEVQNLGDLARFLVSMYLLYLRVSGLFHLAVGILCLFDYDLPATNQHYYLASSFSDYWRRINVYWKDFMMKVFYYPAFFRLRKLGQRNAMVLATVVVFAVTWALHSYQWFWILGTFPLQWSDGIFWGALGLLAVANLVWNETRGSKAPRGNRPWTWAQSFSIAWKTIAVFITVSILWSIWTVQDLQQWRSLFVFTDDKWYRGIDKLALGGAAILVGGTVWGYLHRRGPWAALWSTKVTTPRMVLTMAGIAVLSVIGAERVAQKAGPRAADMIADLRYRVYNKRDQAQADRGYYEELMSVASFSSSVWQVMQERQDEQVFEEGRAPGRRLPPRSRELDFVPLRGGGMMSVPVKGFLAWELPPNQRLEVRGAAYETNEWGMRDRAYSKEKPEGVCRLAVLGASHVVGAGVPVEGTFPSLLEQWLNERAGPGRSYEVLNFAVDNYTMAQHLYLLEQKIIDFEPDLVLMVAHANDASRSVRHLTRWVVHRETSPYPELDRLLRDAGTAKGMAEPEVQKKLFRASNTLTNWSYRRFHRKCREIGAKSVWVYLQTLDIGSNRNRDLFQAARNCGFDAVVDLADVYEDHDKPSLQISESDSHPNADGHRIVGERLFDAVLAVDREQGWGLLPGRG